AARALDRPGGREEAASRLGAGRCLPVGAEEARASAAAERLPLGLLAAAELRGAAGDARELLAARGVEDALLRLEDALRLDPEHAAADDCRAPTLARRQPQLGNDL